MEAFATLTAVAAPMPKPNINTDDIYPGPGASPIAAGMSSRAYSDPAHAGVNAFSAQKYDAAGVLVPDFILNVPPWTEAKIIVAGANFGCGSSREMAVWTLAGIGVRCIIAPSFGDIFFNNCFKNGVLPIRLPQAQVNELLALASDPATSTLTVDLREQVITAPGGRAYPFQVTDYFRQALLEGLDEISATVARMDKIDAFDRRYRAERPWLTL
ncbi:MAG: 3-isopropylmalate dehydratase small subunit [Phenylobacterium sp.]